MPYFAMTQHRRNEVTTAYAAVQRELNQLDLLMARPSGMTETVIARVSTLSDQLLKLGNEYREGLEKVALSRCPISGAKLSHSFDQHGLDGMWWQYHAPIRPMREIEVGPYFLALTGAVQIQSPPEYTEYLVVPGPSVPYVIPRVLTIQQVRAVISTIGIGKHKGFAIAYFANAPIDDVRPPTIWGTDYSTIDVALRSPLDEMSDMEKDFDFDLRPWIQNGKLFWIAPGDTTLSLQSEIEACPYLNLAGTKNIQRLHFGECWTS